MSDHYGVVPKNNRWSWSGRSADGKAVAVTLWRDRFEEKGRVYRSLDDDHGWDGGDSPGRREFIENLEWARDHCDGIVRVIVALPVDPTASPRAIKECYPADKLKMRVVAVDRSTKRFRLERVDSALA